MNLVCFHAHPDDEAISTGGTMVQAAHDGHRVTLVLATRGEHGEPVDGVLVDGEALGARREVEARASGRLLGAHRVDFLGYTDSGMMGEPTNGDPDCFWQAEVEVAARRLADILIDEAADVLTIYDPHGGYGHPDHIQVHRVGTLAAELAGPSVQVYWATMNREQIQRAMAEHPDFSEQLDDERQGRIEDPEPFGWPEAEITHAIDVRPHLATKRSAMAAHESQISPDMFFLSLSEELFAAAFGTEWFVRPGTTRTGDFHDSLFGPAR